MIRPQELRLGNIILFEGHMNYVLSIHSPAPDKAQRFDGKFVVEINPPDSFNVPFDEIEPMLLTEEWLIKFGFISNPYSDRYELGEFHIEHNAERGYSIFWHDKTGVTIENVHQLQNLYFSLTGEELKLNP